MMNNDQKDTRLKVFLSFYHQDDQYYSNQFEELLGHLFIFKSVGPDGLDAESSAGYIKRLIEEDYIDDSSVVVVLAGKKTWGRKHVDWEISAALNKKTGGNCAGLLGLLLPDFPLTSTHKYKFEDIPPRLADNVKTGYAEIVAWQWVCTDESRIKAAIDSAFARRVSEANKVDNSRALFSKNRSK